MTVPLALRHPSREAQGQECEKCGCWIYPDEPKRIAGGDLCCQNCFDDWSDEDENE